MENLKSILQAAGGSLADLVQITRYIVDEARNQDEINRVMAEYLGDHRAATTSVEIIRVATDHRLVVELQGVAVVSE
jgi:enamine deaminase RidA (YjgF/YER057c/UK114 family)